MTNSTDQKHQSAVANYIAGKTSEFQYQLNTIVTECDKSCVAFHSHNEFDGAIVAYGFSAFVNVIQSLKDAITTFSGSPLTWADIGQLPHGTFMYQARNAATHDGNPIVNAWVDGKFYVATNINRLDMRGNPIEIIRPEADIRTISIQFAAGFSTLLRDRLTPLLGQFEIAGSPVNSTELQAIINDSSLIPDDVKQMISANHDDIVKAIENASPFDPVKKAIMQVEHLTAYCDQALANTE